MSAQQARDIDLSASQFELKENTKPGSEKIVATAQVPTGKLWKVPVGKPLVTALVSKQTVTVASGTTASKTLDPEAPKVDYLDDPTNGTYTENAFIVAKYDDSGDGSKDTLVTGSSNVKYTGTFGTSDDFVTDVKIENTAASDKDVDIYTVVAHGVTRIQKRTSGKRNIQQELQTESAISWAFSNPDAPDADRQITWDAQNSGIRGELPPKFFVDIVFYDDAYTVAVDDVNATNLYISLPLKQRALKPDEKPEALRRKVRNSMAE
jgi:hypothetical protein